MLGRGVVSRPVVVTAMTYRIEVLDPSGRRVAVHEEVTLLDATRGAPDEADRIAGILPSAAELGIGYRVRVWVEGELFCEAPVTVINPQWGDMQKLILDRYVTFHEMLAFEAERTWADVDGAVPAGFANAAIGDIVKALINRTPGDVHYRVAHGAYPDGAQREWNKFLARRRPENEMGMGGISEGQWVGPVRIDASNAYAKDGDTLSGLIVDGVSWPDLRLMLVDAEEPALNSHARNIHPETSDWTDARYAISGYKVRADAATAALQTLIETKGVEYIELNPHRDTTGAFDDRVDRYGRYLGMVYGGGECFNAALIEKGHGTVYLWQDGKFLEPDLELKDFFSYAGPSEDSIEPIATVLTGYGVTGSLFEALTQLAYLAEGCVWSIGPDMAVSFRRAAVERVLCHDPAIMGAGLAADADSIANVLLFSGNPAPAGLSKTYRRYASMRLYGDRVGRLRCHAIAYEDDADRLVRGLLDDLAYPNRSGFVLFHAGDAAIRQGDLVELRGAPLRRLDPAAADEWGGRFAGRIVARARSVTHRFHGKHVRTIVRFEAPLRTVANPLSFMARGQESATELYQFRLDDATVGLDMGYHLD
ncbi:MAG TPA: thermonuclease family protein [Candidatus Hydrogenedentes bacterium]|nr:thermonuclease family protein [Candidatus Hydrogenedentota bacterium]HPC15841.1 thermonuclease family protein [Candidatus Hydrogenedentota bacterium]HRT19750.1 thermonuclease family protein [Candidatus Hydrogenedentota bacterium]HRT64524.1 thermonuclease family protein [Candidatus Hydrogenedentota bacterium]